MFAPHCLNVVITFKIADILEEQPEGMHIDEISARSGIDAQKLGRILRLLATRHVFREGNYIPLGFLHRLTARLGRVQSLMTFSPTID